MKRSVLSAAAVLAGLSILLFSACTSLKTDVDNSVLEDVADSVLEEADECSKGDLGIGKPAEEDLLSFSDRLQPGLHPAGEPRWRIDRVGTKEIESLLLTGGPGFFEGDENRFFFFKPADWDGKKAILWAPGFGVSDFALCFLREIFYEELRQGYAVLFYNLPFHLDRVEPGKDEGEGVFVGAAGKNLENILRISEELNQGYLYLRDELGAEKIGGWGGSIGAAALNLLAVSRDFDHLALFIPVLDWNTLIFHPESRGVVEKITGPDCAEEDLSDLFLLVSPVSYRLKTPPDRVLIQYARYDQLTPPRVVREYATNRGISRLCEYPESHSTILLNRNVYREYADFLRQMEGPVVD